MTGHTLAPGKMVGDRAAELRALADWIEAEGATAELLTEAWAAVNPKKPADPHADLSAWFDARDNFDALIECPAFLSAAEFLVPDGWRGQVEFSGGYPGSPARGYVTLLDPEEYSVYGSGPALAAALRAHATILEDGDA